MTDPAPVNPRAALLADVSARAQRTVAGGAAIVVLNGDAGSGKTTVAQAIVAAHHDAHGAAAVLWAHAMPWEADRPGAVIAQLLQVDSVAGDVSSAVAALRGVVDGEGPYLVVIDDAEYVDDLSMHALQSLLARQRVLPVLVIVTVGGGHGGTIDWAAAETVAVPALSPDDIAQWAGAQGIVLHPTLAQRLTVHTGGNPRAVRAVFAETPADGWTRPDVELVAPRYVVDDVARRLERCTASGRALVEALAITTLPTSGAGLGESALADTTELAGIADPLAALDDAAAAGLVVVSGGLRPADAVPRLRNPMERAAVITIMGMAATGRAHRRAAELATDPARRLQHLVAATPLADPALADQLEQIAAQRGADGEWGDAARLFRQSSRLTADPLARDERLTRGVDALLAAGDCVAASALVPAVESLRETPLRDATLAYLAILRGRATEADMRLDRAWDICNINREPDTAGVIAQRRVLHSLVCCRGSELVDWADTAIRLSGSRSSAAIEASVIKGLGLAWSGQIDAARDMYSGLTATIVHGAQAQRVTMGRGWLELGLDDVDAARSSLETAVSMAQLGGSTRITLWALGWLSRVQFVTGDWDLGLATVERGRQLARRSGIALATPLLEWTAAQIHSSRGNWSLADDAVSASVVADGSYEIMAVPTLLARAARAEAAADYGRAREALTPLIPLARKAPGLTEPGFWPWVDVLANALVVQGRLAEADKVLAPHENRAHDRGHRSAQARLGYARGRLLGAAGELPAAKRSFEEALSLIEGLPLRYDRARINFAYGQTLRRAGKRRAADAVITRARELFESLGAHTYVARCDRELRAGGLNAPRGSRDGVELTPQEEAVSALVVQGLSNREVAAELYISPKTVQYHLTRIFGKMGVRSRSELTARLK